MSATGQQQTEARRAGRSILVVSDHDNVADHLRQRYPDWHVAESESFLSAIARLTQEPVETILACVEADDQQLADELGGLREAAGDETRVLLCCRSEAEPLVRSLLDAGADDYVLYPLEDDELGAALFEHQPKPVEEDAAVKPTMSELNALGEVVSRLDSEPEKLVQSLTDLVRTAFSAKAARVVFDGNAQTSGAEAFEAVLIEPIFRGDKSIGHVSVGVREGGEYTSFDAEKLRHYARLVGQIASAGMKQRRWFQLAYRDELSDLPNRRYLMYFLDKLLVKMAAANRPVTVLMFDIDDFKEYNDRYGHDAGDEIIRGCGHLFRSSCRDHDLVTRYGGDEFVVVFWDKAGPREPGSHHPTTVLPIIERCRQSLREHKFERFKLPPKARLTISGGLAGFPEDGSTAEALISRADEALYRAKRDGKNRIYLGSDPKTSAF